MYNFTTCKVILYTLYKHFRKNAIVLIILHLNLNQNIDTATRKLIDITFINHFLIIISKSLTQVELLQ